MHAALVTSFATPPIFQEVPDLRASAEDEVVVDVLAAGLHPRVRSQADGSHYTVTGELPLVPGIDGVGRDPDGVLRYFVLPDTTQGAMAEQTVIDRRRSIPLPEGTDPVAVAAAMNPAMSSWVALRRRVELPAAASILVLGATGSSGQLAVQIGRRLGASRIVAAGRDPDRLAAVAELGADTCVDLRGTPGEAAGRLAAVAADVDIVLDYLWGEPTAAAMTAIVTHRPDRSRPLSWIDVGSVAAPDAAIPSAALRAANLQVIGSGQGSVPTRDYLAELPALVTEIATGRLAVRACAVPLRDVAAAWADIGSADRIVITP